MPEPTEPQVRFFSPMPPGYQFVEKGDVYVTANCRKRTRAAGQVLYVVVDKHKKPIGLRCPISIYRAVVADGEATAGSRAAAVSRRDAVVESSFEDALVALFPRAPRDEIPTVLKQTLKKRSRRVGRTTTLALRDRVALAVRAHVRHCHTAYDDLLRQGVGRVAARAAVRGEIERIVRAWRGGASQKVPFSASRSRRKGRLRADAASKAGSGGTKGTARGREEGSATGRDWGRARAVGSKPAAVDGKGSASRDAPGTRRSLRIAQAPPSSFAGMDLGDGSGDEEFSDSEDLDEESDWEL